MNLSQITALAIRQLDENPEDAAEYAELFSVYANIGYDLAIRKYLKPRECFEVCVGPDGSADIEGLPIERVVEARDEEGRLWPFALSADGLTCFFGPMAARKRGTGGKRELPRVNEACGMKGPRVMHLLCEVRRPPMIKPTDEPMLPQSVQPALADYICYRALSNGSAARQDRAAFFLSSFTRQMAALRPQGAGSVTKLRNLYSATDIRVS